MDGSLHVIAGREPDLDTPEEREKYYQELVKARAAERKRAIAEGKMDDPLVPKRLEDAITIVGTCMDMCPRFERYRRERENNLFEWESIPGTKRVDHNRAVKMYERAAGDKTLPSDLRPPHVLKSTLDYLFHDLLPRGGLVQTCNFVRDRSRAVRNDFTMQHITGPLAIECHDRCARFHILTLHMVRDLEQNQVGFIQMEEQQLMNTLQSLKEFYEDQRGRYESPTELEMRVYHRLIHIRDQKERHEDIPNHITAHPVFKLTTDFRRHVQQKSAPISKTSPLVVDAEAMAIFGRLAAVLGEQGGLVMIYLVACILERLFGKETVEDIEAIRGELSISDIIDGISTDAKADDRGMDEMEADDWREDATEPPQQQVSHPTPLKPNSNGWFSSSFTPQPSPSTTAPLTAPPVATSAFAGLVSTPNVFGTPSIFGGSVFSNFTTSVFDTQPQVSFDGLATSTSISIVPTPGAAIDSTPLAIWEESDIINGISTNDKEDDRAVDETEELEPDDFQEDATEPQQVSPPTPLKPSSDGWLSSSFTSQPFTSQPSPSTVPAPSAPPVATSAFTKLVSTPNIFDISSIFGNSAFSGLNQPPTSAMSDTRPQVGFDGPVASTSISVVPTPPAATINPAPLAVRGELIVSDITGDISTNIKADDRVVDEVDATEADDWQEDATELEPVSLLNQFEPTSNGWSSPSFTLQPSTSTTPAITSLPVVTSNILGLVSTPNVVATPSIFGSSALSSLNQPSTTSVSDTQSQVGFGELAASTSISIVPSSPVVAIDPTSNGSPQSPPPAPTTQPQPLTNGKKRISTTAFASGEDKSPPTQRKRARRRISSQYHPPRTDEELAKRFKENHEEHELRWAQGSFLQVIRKHVKMRRPATLKLPWQIWLSMNPESDATAIWLDRKFDIPASGSWVSDSIFAIPLSFEVSSGSILSGSPGVIVFECTPLGDVADNLEKKYRILDDCSRLRDIIKALPVKRRYIPSLLIISWTEGEESHGSSDFFDMVKKLVADSVLQSCHVFAMTSATKDLDNILNGALESLDLDLEGKLVQSLSLRGVFKLFEPTLDTFLNEWIENCSTNRDFNWRLYGQVVQVCVTLFNTMSLLVQSLLEVRGEQDPLPAFDYPQIEDSESTFDNVNEWLSHWVSRDNARMVAMDLQSHRNIGQDFPSRVFIEHLFEICQTQFQRLHSKVSSNTQLIVPTSSITSSVDSFKAAMQNQHIKLLQTLNFSVRRSPKRRLDSVAPSEQGSPGAKRPRFPVSIASTNDDHSVPSTPLVNGRESLSPTNSMMSLGNMEEQQPTITVAMLRALTRDMKRKYARS